MQRQSLVQKSFIFFYSSCHVKFAFPKDCIINKTWWLCSSTWRMTIKVRALILSVSLVIAYMRRDMPVKATDDDNPNLVFRCARAAGGSKKDKKSQYANACNYTYIFYTIFARKRGITRAPVFFRRRIRRHVVGASRRGSGQRKDMAVRSKEDEEGW